MTSGKMDDGKGRFFVKIYFKERFLRIYLHMSKNCSTFAAESCKDNKNMAQETLNGLLQYVIQTLSPEDKQWFARQLVDDAFEKEQVQPYTWDEARDRLATAREQFQQGKYMTHEEVMHSQMREAV